VKFEEAAQGQLSPNQELAKALRTLGNYYRLDILRLLDSGDLSVTAIAGALGVSTAQTQGHLKKLVAAGLVESYPTEVGQHFHLNRSKAALLNVSVVSLLGRAGSPMPSESPLLGPAHVQPLAIPPAPETCLHCQDSAFVRAVLDDMDRILAETRQCQRRLQQLSSQVLTAHEGERKRIARELHDDTAQALTSILVRLRLLERSAGDGDIRQSLKELRALTANTLDSVRRMAVDLRPIALDDLGLVAAIRSYVERFLLHWPVRVEFSSQGLQRWLPATVELVLYRVTLEALSNVAKHSGASWAKVTLSRRKSVVTATVQDNGHGFDVDAAMGPGQAGLGLFGMRERLALVDGWLQIESSAGEGTLVTARVPLYRWEQRGD